MGKFILGTNVPLHVGFFAIKAYKGLNKTLGKVLRQTNFLRDGVKFQEMWNFNSCDDITYQHTENLAKVFWHIHNLFLKRKILAQRSQKQCLELNRFGFLIFNFIAKKFARSWIQNQVKFYVHNIFECKTAQWIYTTHLQPSFITHKRFAVSFAYFSSMSDCERDIKHEIKLKIFKKLSHNRTKKYAKFTNTSFRCAKCRENRFKWYIHKVKFYKFTYTCWRSQKTFEKMKFFYSKTS